MLWMQDGFVRTCGRGLEILTAYMIKIMGGVVKLGIDTASYLT